MADQSEISIAVEKERELRSKLDLAEYNIVLEACYLAQHALKDHPAVETLRKAVEHREALQVENLAAMRHTNSVMSVTPQQLCLEVGSVH